MDWLKRMNAAIDYIERNLDRDIDYSQAAKAACCSTYHFQRMFSFISEVSLSEYIRRRRLTMAAFELNHSGVKITDVALKYGYMSVDAFSRAFKTLHGLTPQQAKVRGARLKAYPKITFHISIKGSAELNYRIEEKTEFTVFGVETILHMDNERYKTEALNFWKKFYRTGMNLVLRPNPDGLYLAIMGYEDVGVSKMPFMICSVKKESDDTSGFREIYISAATWAIFPTEVVPRSQIAGSIQDVMNRIFTEWLPTACYEYASLPHCEFYYGTEENRYCEIWLPIIKVQESIKDNLQ